MEGAHTSPPQAQSLTFRKHLRADVAMVPPFLSPTPVRLCMHLTLIPFSIAFFHPQAQITRILTIATSHNHTCLMHYTGAANKHTLEENLH
nr:DUF192 domain-containing protein [Thermus scotoductus]